jgi:SsrA-binding protein
MKVLVKNKKAFHEYEILERIVAGIVLVGSEVKSLKLANVSITESYCYIRDGEIFIKDMHIGIYKEGGSHNNHEPLRERKLLLKKKEITKLNESLATKGLTIIPLCILISDTHFIKLEIGLGKGKNLYDKKNSLKEKDIKRELSRNL